MKISRIKRNLMIAVLTAVILICGYQLWKMSERYVREAWVKKSVAKYRPSDILAQQERIDPLKYIPEELEEDSTDMERSEPKIKINRFIINLQNEINKDIIGWIAIPETKIDYPFVIANDNNYYLRKDLFGNYALAGSIFMDYRCPKDFSGFNSIIYGHNMKNDAMFGDLRLFEDENFFESNKYGTLFLQDRIYTLEFFAYMDIRKDDSIIYNPYAASADRDDFIEHVRESARNYRELEVTGNVVTLSTCSNDGGARIVLLASIITNIYSGQEEERR